MSLSDIYDPIVKSHFKHKYGGSGGPTEDWDGSYTVHPEIIPEGATYTVNSTGEVLKAGDLFPVTVETSDKYTFGDYRYICQDIDGSTGWGVSLNLDVTDRNQTAYGPILENINGVPVAQMGRTFGGCTALIEAPAIPASVTRIDDTFYNCTSLVSAPAISASVTSMERAFSGCATLTTAPDMSDAVGVVSMNGAFSGCSALTDVPSLPPNVQNMQNTFTSCGALVRVPAIPASVESMLVTFANCTSLVNAPDMSQAINVTNMLGTFMNCTSLTGSITLNATPTMYDRCLEGTQITEILGSCGNKEAILATKTAA